MINFNVNSYHLIADSVPFSQIFKHHHVYQAWNTLPSTTVTGIEEQTEAVVEANDTLMERVDKILDMLKQDKHSNKLELQQKASKNVSLEYFVHDNPPAILF